MLLGGVRLSEGTGAGAGGFPREQTDSAAISWQSGTGKSTHLLPALTRFVWAGSVWQMQRRGQCSGAAKELLFVVTCDPTLASTWCLD